MGSIRIWTRLEIEEALARCPTAKLPIRASKAQREAAAVTDQAANEPQAA